MRGDFMSVKDKMDVLDLIINILMEHEKRLDNIVERLENNIESIEYLIKKEKIYTVSQIERSP